VSGTAGDTPSTFGDFQFDTGHFWDFTLPPAGRKKGRLPKVQPSVVENKTLDAGVAKNSICVTRAGGDFSLSVNLTPRKNCTET